MSDKKSRPIEATVEAAKENIKTSEQTDSSPDVLKRESLEFLKKLRPGGPWVLTAITPDGPATTITATNADEALAFVRANDGKKNIYYSVNPTRTPMTKKATKADIAAIEFGLADLDPNDGETPEDAKARYLAALETHGLLGRRAPLAVRMPSLDDRAQIRPMRSGPIAETGQGRAEPIGLWL